LRTQFIVRVVEHQQRDLLFFSDRDRIDDTAEIGKYRDAILFLTAFMDPVDNQLAT